MPGAQNQSPYVKDAFHQYVVSGNNEAINPAKTGTKAAARYVLDVPPGGSTFAARVADADEFYNRITPASVPMMYWQLRRENLQSG